MLKQSKLDFWRDLRSLTKVIIDNAKEENGFKMITDGKRTYYVNKERLESFIKRNNVPPLVDGSMAWIHLSTKVIDGEGKILKDLSSKT